MRTIKTYPKGAPFYNASASRNVAMCVVTWHEEGLFLPTIEKHHC